MKFMYLYNVLFSLENALSKYMYKGDAIPNVKAVGNQVAADITTSFTVLIAIFFPSVTGI